MVEKMLRLPAVLAARGNISKSKHYADIRAGRFPKPAKMGPRVSVWSESDLEAERQALIKARETDARGS